MSRVIHTGQALVDLVLTVPTLPPRGGNVMAWSDTRYPGGAVNVLVAAARTGAVAVHAGAHGTGPHGDLVRRTLAAEGVACSDEPVAGRDTGVCVVLVEPSAERTFVTTRGAERMISAESLARSTPVPGDLVCVTGYTLLEETRQPLLTWLGGLPEEAVVVIDPGAPFATLPVEVRSAMLRRTNVWTSNAQEAADLTGATDIETALGVLASLLRKGAVAIVRDGPRGCYLRENGQTTALPGHPQRAVDTNGAGDAHTGVLVGERGLGADWCTAATRANAAGAMKVTRAGPATAPTRAEVDAFLAAR